MAGQALRWAYDLLFEDIRQAPILTADMLDAGARRVIGTLRRSVRDPIDQKHNAVTTAGAEVARAAVASMASRPGAA
jgi:hypothetical protein